MKNFVLIKDESKQQVSYTGSIEHEGMAYEYTLNQQAGSAVYRGRVTVLSPETLSPIEFDIMHPYAKGGPKKSRVKYCDIRVTKPTKKKIQKEVEKIARKICSNNAAAFNKLLGNTLTPDTITPEIAGQFYAETYINTKYAKLNRTEATLTKKREKLKDILSDFDDTPMKDVDPAQVDRVMKNHSEDYILLHDFWQFCIDRHFCNSQTNPVIIPASPSSNNSKNKTETMSIVPEKVFQKLQENCVNNHTGPDCGTALHACELNKNIVCSCTWDQFDWPDPENPAYAIIKYQRDDVSCAIHTYDRPLLPFAAETLYNRLEDLKSQFSLADLGKMHPASTKSDPKKAMLVPQLGQEVKKALIEAGISNNALLQAKQNRKDNVSSRILEKTYKYLLVKKCGIPEDSGTFKYLCGHTIQNDVTSSNYLSFSSEIGLKRLYKLLLPTGRIKVNTQTASRQENINGKDIISIRPDKTNLCSGLILEVELAPGEKMRFDSEDGCFGHIDVH